MADATKNPEWNDRPIYGYDSPAVQEHYLTREADTAASFLLPHLKSGMSLLDCGCGPGTITLGLAEAVAPGQAVGIDLEPRMVEVAASVAKERNIDNVRFEVADIRELPFPDDSFDVVFTSAVIEHISDPVKGLEEIHRVLKPGALAGVIKVDWRDPMISPESEALSRFFDLFERGFNRYGGSLNRGRHLRSMMHEAGFDVIDYTASYSNATTTEEVTHVVRGYINWMENLPLFEESIALGWIDRPTLHEIEAEMMKWAEQPGAFLAMGRSTALGRKG